MKRKACYILPYLVFGVSALLPARAFTQTQPSQSGVSINKSGTRQCPYRLRF